jgi:uncharacterized protein YegJ (DUF2314 family)
MLASIKMKTARTALGLLAVVLFWPNAASAAQQQKFPAGSPMKDTVVFQYAVYFLPKPAKDPKAVLQAVLRTRPNSPRLVEKPPRSLAKPVMTAYVEKEVAQRYAPPDLEALQYSGRGLSRQQAQALQKSGQALIMTFGHTREHGWSALKAATEIAETLARETDGLIWDEETREIFTPDEWRKRRIATWTGTLPDVTRHTTIHAYKNGEYVRAITLGMAKFGLPDVVVQDFSWSLNRNMGHLVNALCQSLAEGGRVAKAGAYALDFRAIKNRGLRDEYLGSLKPNAKAVARLTLMQGTPEDGDPRNRLIEVAFDQYPGADVHERQDAMISALFGWEDSIKRIRHDGELEAASKRARARLPSLRKAFSKGLEPGEFIQVKAPFATPNDSNEWMWVEVTEWQGSRIRGLLRNEPFDIPGLHGGQIVQVQEEKVFDYIRRYPNGKEEGNETGRIIEKMRGSVETNK